MRRHKPYNLSKNQSHIIIEPPVDKNNEWDNSLSQISNAKSEISRDSARSLRFIFPRVKNKKKAWKDLIRLTENHDQEIRLIAAKLLGRFFKDVPNKRTVYRDLYRLTRSNDWSIRLGLAKSLGFSFNHFQDKRKAWNELIQLTKDEIEDIKVSAIDSLGNAFRHSPDKEQAWIYLYCLVTNNNNFRIKFSAVRSLIKAIKYVPDKQKSWNDLFLLIKDDSHEFKVFLVGTIGTSFKHIPFKKKTLNKLILLTTDSDISVRLKAIESLVSSFPHIPDNKTWNHLIKLTKDKNKETRAAAADSLGPIFQHMPDKRKAWNDLVRLVRSNRSKTIKLSIAKTLFSSFPHIFNKNKAWGDFHSLEKDGDDYLKVAGNKFLDPCFSGTHNKREAWDCMSKFLSDENNDVRRYGAYIIGYNFPSVPNKHEIWNELVRLTADNNGDVRSFAILALRHSFPHAPDKNKSWADLISLIKTSNYEDVRRGVAYKLSFGYQYVPNKEMAWDNLVQLTKDEDRNVKTSAYYTLGKASILKATESKDKHNYEKALKEAIDYFEKATIESSHFFNPSKFCLPFYRLFYMTIFIEQDYKNDMERCIEEAKNASLEFKDREFFLKILENIDKALEEVKSLREKNIADLKSSLITYKVQCDNILKLIQEYKKDSILSDLMEVSIRIMNEKVSAVFYDVNDIFTPYKDLQETPIEEITYSAFKTRIPDDANKELILEDVNEIINKRVQTEQDLLEKLKQLEESIEMMKLVGVNMDIEREKPTIGVVTALPKESSVIKMLLENQKNHFVEGRGANRRYVLGEISSKETERQHNVVLATVGMGNNLAATRASLLLERFPNVKSIIMVGIAGGIPNPDDVDNHVRLGDIVVSNESGVIQYDNIKKEFRKIKHRNPPRPPSASLLDIVKYLEEKEILGDRPWEIYIDQALSQLNITRPNIDKDILYSSSNEGEIITHPQDPKRVEGRPRVFTGPIASANVLQKDSKERDKLRDKFGVKALEMEASGIADATWNQEVGYLVVRGICDYCDSHKNDDWQQYAAVVAAAYTRALIESMP